MGINFENPTQSERVRFQNIVLMYKAEQNPAYKSLLDGYKKEALYFLQQIKREENCILIFLLKQITFNILE